MGDYFVEAFSSINLLICQKEHNKTMQFCDIMFCYKSGKYRWKMGCDTKIVIRFLFQDHIEQCQLVPVDCVNACGRSDIPRNQVWRYLAAVDVCIIVRVIFVIVEC